MLVGSLFCWAAGLWHPVLVIGWFVKVCGLESVVLSRDDFGVCDVWSVAQAKMANLEQEVLALKTQLGDMKVKNDTLSNQNGLLSRVLDFKDYQMVALQEDAKVRHLSNAMKPVYKACNGLLQC